MADFETLLAKDTVSGQEGRATQNIDGEITDMFFAKAITATFEKNKVEVKTLGKRATQHKAIGWSGSGTMTIYYMTTEYRKMALKYAKTGVDTNFQMTITNEDPTSSIGAQTIVLYNVNIDSTDLAKLDVDAEVLDEEVAFTFDDFDILDEFGRPVSFAQ